MHIRISLLQTTELLIPSVRIVTQNNVPTGKTTFLHYHQCSHLQRLNSSVGASAASNLNRQEDSSSQQDSRSKPAGTGTYLLRNYQNYRHQSVSIFDLQKRRVRHTTSANEHVEFLGHWQTSASPKRADFHTSTGCRENHNEILAKSHSDTPQ